MRAKARWFAAVALTTVLAVATGVALSEWAATGVGSGGAQATTGQDLTLTVEVGDASSECPAANLVVGEPSLPLDIARWDTGTVDVEVALPPDADDACQGAWFPLEYTVLATKAR